MTHVSSSGSYRQQLVIIMIVLRALVVGGDSEAEQQLQHLVVPSEARDVRRIRLRVVPIEDLREILHCTHSASNLI
jgi:hypothetical protein